MTADEAIAKMRTKIDSGELTLVDVAEQLIRTIASFEEIYTATNAGVNEQLKLHTKVIFDGVEKIVGAALDELRADLLSAGGPIDDKIAEAVIEVCGDDLPPEELANDPEFGKRGI